MLWQQLLPGQCQTVTKFLTHCVQELIDSCGYIEGNTWTYALIPIGSVLCSNRQVAHFTNDYIPTNPYPNLHPKPKS